MSTAPCSSPNGSPTRLLLVRHGQSVWNADGRWQGQADPALTELGERQAFDAARRIGMVEAVYASDLERAAKTAQIIAGQLGLGSESVTPARGRATPATRSMRSGPGCSSRGSGPTATRTTST